MKKAILSDTVEKPAPFGYSVATNPGGYIQTNLNIIEILMIDDLNCSISANGCVTIVVPGV